MGHYLVGGENGCASTDEPITRDNKEKSKKRLGLRRENTSQQAGISVESKALTDGSQRRGVSSRLIVNRRPGGGDDWRKSCHGWWFLGRNNDQTSSKEGEDLSEQPKEYMGRSSIY